MKAKCNYCGRTVYRPVGKTHWLNDDGDLHMKTCDAPIRYYREHMKAVADSLRASGELELARSVEALLPAVIAAKEAT